MHEVAEWHNTSTRYMLARYPHATETWVGWCHTIDLTGLCGDSDFCAALFFPPTFLDDEAISMAMEDGRHVNFYALAFLYRSELDFVLAEGSSAFFDKLEEAGIGPVEFAVLDTDRPNAV